MDNAHNIGNNTVCTSNYVEGDNLMPDECVGCNKLSADSPTGCGAYTHDISWVTRRGGCPMNQPFAKVQKIKVNPLKASKRAGR